MAFYIKQNDTSPAILRQLLNAAGNPVDLTGATVVFNMASVAGTLVCNANAASVFTGTLPAELGGGTVTAADGWVRYIWTATDTAAPGQYIAEFQVTYADSSVETAPNASFESVTITPDISAANYPYVPPAPDATIGVGAFATRAEFVTWAATAAPSVGQVIDAAGYSYRYTGSGTVISDLAGWVPDGDIYPEHFGTVDGTADEVQINLASAYAAGLTGVYGSQGIKLRGNYTIAAPIVLRTGVRIVGEGWASVTLANNANCNMFETPGWAGYLGSNSTADSLPHGFGLFNLAIDGNMANQSPANPDLCNGIAVYGYAPTFADLVITNIKGHGWRSEYGQYGEPEAGMEPHYENIKIDTCGRHGVWYKGPHDANFSHVIVIDAGQEADNTYDGHLFEGFGSARCNNIHAWHRGYRTNRMAYNLDAQSVEIVDSHFEGGRKLVRVNGNVQISNSRIYHQFGTGACIEVNGDYNRISGIFKALLTSNRPPVIDLGPSSACGSSTIDLVVQNSTTGTNPVLTITNSAGNNRVDLVTINCDTANMISGSFHSSDYARITQNWPSGYDFHREGSYLTRTNGLASAFPEVVDSAFTIVDDGDTTKKARFNVSQIASGQTLTFNLPGTAGTLLSSAANLTLTGAIAHTNNFYRYQPTPYAPAGSVTPTLVQMQTQAINYTGAAGNITMPTNTALDAANTWAVNSCLQFSVINTGSGTATILGNTGVTTLGNMAVAAGESGSFLLRKSAASTYIVMRMS